MIENNFFVKKTTHSIHNLTVWCIGTLKFLGVPYRICLKSYRVFYLT